MKNISHIITKRGEKELFEMCWQAPPALCNGAVDGKLWRKIHYGLESVAWVCAGNVKENIDEHIRSIMQHRTEDA